MVTFFFSIFTFLVFLVIFSLQSLRESGQQEVHGLTVKVNEMQEEKERTSTQLAAAIKEKVDLEANLVSATELGQKLREKVLQMEQDHENTSVEHPEALFPF